MGVQVVAEVHGIEAMLAKIQQHTGLNMTARAQRGFLKGGEAIAGDAKDRAPYRTGNLRRAIFFRPAPDYAMGVEIVAPPINGVPYPFWVHEGTGIYGPRGAPIVPLRGKFLVFQTQGGIVTARSGKSRRGPGSVVFARSVKGTPPNPFLRDAAEAGRRGLRRTIVAELQSGVDAFSQGNHGGFV